MTTVPRNLISLLILLTSAFLVTAQQSTSAVYRFSFPGKPWSIDLLTARLTDFFEEINDNRYLFSAGPEKTKELHAITISIRMERAAAPGDAQVVRESAKKRLSKSNVVVHESVKLLMHNEVPLIRYSLDASRMFNSPFGGSTDFPKMRILEGYYVKDDIWITISANFADLTKADESFFSSLLDSVRIVETSKPVTSFDYYHKGRTSYLQKQFADAIQSYSSALELERTSSSLDKERWRLLVLQLADSYAAIDNSAGFKKTLEYGVEKEPTYSAFHWALARYYAATDDLDNTIASLEKAFANATQEPPSKLQLKVSPIDPLKDPAFARYKKNEKFLKALKAMKSQKH